MAIVECLLPSSTSRKDAPDEAIAKGSNAQNYTVGIISLNSYLVRGTFY
jgi:hypothetical protein